MPRSVRRVMEATMTPLLTVPVQGYEVCRPAAGTRTAFNSQDFGTSHWQLMIDGYTSFTRLQKGAAMAGAGTHSPFAPLQRYCLLSEELLLCRGGAREGSC